MNTHHQALLSDARDLSAVGNASVHLIVTSPPYPMIGMWDELFGELSPGVSDALITGDGNTAFELMHTELDRVWRECHRTLVPGGITCINIGDATRTIGGDFQLFSNHARIIQGMRRAGFALLPDILWRKPTNAPNKFMGSGMLPAGAYVTYEHEYILILRKSGKREFAHESEKASRRRSAYFWEERNAWFSDLWMDLVGTRQALLDSDARARSAAFPLELPYRLIQMFSIQGDTILDPFVGIGTTMVAAVAAARNSIGVERDASLSAKITEALSLALRVGNERLTTRINAHREFVANRLASGKTLGHINRHYGFPVITRQEIELVFDAPQNISIIKPNLWTVSHTPHDTSVVAHDITGMTSKRAVVRCEQ